MAETLRHRAGGHRASLDEEAGQEERTVEGMAKRREGAAPFIPFKAADTCQDTLNRFAFSVASQDERPGVHPHDFYSFNEQLLIYGSSIMSL
jgi:hypothetical protein